MSMKNIISEMLIILSDNIINKYNDMTGKHCYLILDNNKTCFYEDKDGIEILMGIIFINEHCLNSFCEYGEILKYTNLKDIARSFYLLNILNTIK